MTFTNTKNKIYFPFYIHLIIYSCAAFLFAYNIDITMVSDGLRHISFAANMETMKSWGEIFPKSLFSEYDPWNNWHYLLAIFVKIFTFEYAHIAVNTLCLFALMLIIDNHLRREVNYDLKSLIYIVVFSIVIFTYHRYMNLRPDLLSGLFILFALLLKNRFLPIFILTLFYGPFYYVYYVYTAFLGLTFLIQKKFRLFFGVFLASILVLIIYLFQGGKDFIDLIIYVLSDQELRQGLNVSESMPLINFFYNFDKKVLLILFVSFCSIFIYLKYEYFKAHTIELFLLVTSILWINQLRFFYLFLPLFLILFLSLVINSNKKKLFYTFRKYVIVLKRYINYSSKSKIFYLIAIPYSIFIFSYAFNGESENKQLESASFFKSSEFNNKTILLNHLHLDIYRALYYNPTIHFVPSCGVGWFDNTNKEMKDIYIRMQKKHGITEEELSSLIKYVNADLYIHYLIVNEEQVLDFEKLRKLGIIPKKIFKNRIIFEIIK